MWSSQNEKVGTECTSPLICSFSSVCASFTRNRAASCRGKDTCAPKFAFVTDCCVCRFVLKVALERASKGLGSETESNRENMGDSSSMSVVLFALRAKSL